MGKINAVNFILIIIAIIMVKSVLQLSEMESKVTQLEHETVKLKQELHQLNAEIDNILEDIKQVKVEIENNKQNIGGIVAKGNTAKVASLNSPTEQLNLTDSDLTLLAKIVHAEAKGESHDGKVAVANVVLNRVESEQFPDTIEGVIYQKGQFQPVKNGAINNTPNEDTYKAIEEALEGREKLTDDEKGILYFYNPEIATSNWIRTREVVLTIGNHSFAK